MPDQRDSGRARRTRTRGAVPDPDTARLVPRHWPMLAGILGIGLICGALTDEVMPPWPVLLCVTLAALVALASRRIERVFRLSSHEHGGGPRLPALLMAPIVLSCLGFGSWTALGGPNLAWAAGTLACLAAVSAAMLSQRPLLAAASNVIVWLTLGVASETLSGAAAAVVASGVLTFAAYRQAGFNRMEEENARTRERIRTRAQDILSDYEDTGQGWFWETDRRGQLTYVSASVARVLGFAADDLIGRPFGELFDLEDVSGEGERTLTFHLSARAGFTELAVRAGIAHEERWWSVNGRPIYDEFHNFCGFRGSGTDLTEKRRSDQHATRLAHFDSLTGLANRFQMSQSLEKILNAPLEMHRECAVFLLDLDRFKNVNDTMGHPAGDALLKQVAQRLESAVGSAGRVGRLGGDEFQVVLPGRNPRQQLATLARGIIASLSQPYQIDGQRVVIGASLGIALSPDDGTTSESLIRNADLALYAAKDGGRGRFHFYAADLHTAAEARGRLEEDLRDAIANGDLQLHYQPVVHTTTEKITGFEALLRWQHPAHGWISPARFIPIAEESGLVNAIGEWALRTACQDLARWPEEVRCAVNVSPIQFADASLPDIVGRAISEAGIDPARLELEITESVFLGDNSGTDAMFAALKGIGVRLALDDFGTGYSSLGYLKRAPFDKIKIDQSFVRGATEAGSRNGAIIASITSLAQALGMDTTAEGVETMDELDLVRMYGCSHVQGYIYERPLAAEDASERLRTGLAAIARGPRSARAARHTMLRRVKLEHAGQIYDGTIRNISATGILVVGLWNVPVGTIFRIAISETVIVTATTRWSSDDRMGMEFATPLERDASGQLLGIHQEPAPAVRGELRRSA